MKKRFGLITLVTCILLCGCGNSKEARLKKYQSTLEEYARNYYETYVKDHTDGFDIYEVSIETLKNANDAVGASYDLKKLDGCKKESHVDLTLNKETKEIISVEYKLNCK